MLLLLFQSPTLHVVDRLLTFQIEAMVGPIDRRSDRTRLPDANGKSTRNRDRAGAECDADANSRADGSRTKGVRGIPVRNGYPCVREKSRERNS